MPGGQGAGSRRAPAATRGSYQPKPLPSGPSTPTQKSLGVIWRRFEEDVWLGAYRRSDRRVARWDAAAKRFLAQFVRCVTDAPAPVPVESVLASALELQRRKCDHPLVLLAMAEVCCFMHQDRLAAPLYSSVLPSLDSRVLDPRVAWVAPLGLARSKAPGEFRPGEREQLLARGTEASADAASRAAYAPFEEHWLWWRLREDHEGPESRAFLAALQSRKTASLWIVKMLTGEVELHQAHLAARQHRRDPDHHLASAHAAFAAAWQLHPEYPDAAVRLIGCPGDGESARLWFDRAVAADFDCPEAYDNYRDALPLEDRLPFGRECLATARFDTGVPWQYAEALTRLLELPAGAVDTAAVGPELRRLASGYGPTRPGLAARARVLASRLPAARR